MQGAAVVEMEIVRENEFCLEKSSHVTILKPAGKQMRPQYFANQF
jgi:hypothetical protein